MSEVTVRALQNTVEFEPGAVFTTDRTPRIEQLIRDGRIEEVTDGDTAAIASEVLTGSAAVVSADAEKDSGHIAAVDPGTGETVEANVQAGGVQYGADQDDTPPAATESDTDEPAPEEGRKTSGRARKPKTDTE
ncbi:hypothetical protein [Rhodococcoides kyotonense]|uniref:Uncharacterized protein n=1 Tax=Rhodococcoides kyotonense TaxID=398843 RepID=A0A239FNH4_9NOCA|nr:hypothetical protein [Rhodococcus kyotonensis]SNS58168.1 hypothetical protein SAMN05421642_103375 [Rhodococcus kyotonensis]